MLVGSNDGRIDNPLFQISVAAQRLGDSVPDTLRFPTGEPHIHGVPVAKLGRQVAPWIANPSGIQNRLDEQTVVRCPAAFVSQLLRQQGLNSLPLRVAQHSPIHCLHPNSRM